MVVQYGIKYLNGVVIRIFVCGAKAQEAWRNGRSFGNGRFRSHHARRNRNRSRASSFGPEMLLIDHRDALEATAVAGKRILPRPLAVGLRLSRNLPLLPSTSYASLRIRYDV